ncbi:uncharacterized protein [Antedon mediterranea]|uniref:uncharacterized protein isoform X2 n=1 Tax=Antedon mediterranea TaxID=105859 RepID=UPI003AF63D3D
MHRSIMIFIVYITLVFIFVFVESTTVVPGTATLPIRECPMRKCVPCDSGVYRIDEHGCRTCECVIECPMIDCVKECPDNMYQADENGCQTCDCECPLPNCIPCKSNKYAIDEYGCQTCDCVNDVPSFLTSPAGMIVIGILLLLLITIPILIIIIIFKTNIFNNKPKPGFQKHVDGVPAS